LSSSYSKKQVYLSRHSRLPIIYISPEAYVENKDYVIFSKQTDIWAFGCTIFEVIGRTAPWISYFEEHRNKEGNRDEALKQFYKELRTKIYPSMIKNNSPTVREVFMNQNVEEYQNVSQQLVDLMFKCLEVDVEKRFNVHQLVEELLKLTNSKQTQLPKQKNISNIQKEEGIFKKPKEGTQAVPIYQQKLHLTSQIQMT